MCCRLSRDHYHELQCLPHNDERMYRFPRSVGFEVSWLTITPSSPKEREVMLRTCRHKAEVCARVCSEWSLSSFF